MSFFSVHCLILLQELEFIEDDIVIDEDPSEGSFK
jgi:hypothetical protein